MSVLVLFAVLLLAAVAAPFLGVDSRDARDDRSTDDRGWWPARPALTRTR